MEPHQILRDWIVGILEERQDVLNLAARQRAKFEGWLKFELAAFAESKCPGQTVIEASYGDNKRSDLSLEIKNERVFIELKTCNTNWRMSGADSKHRPITKNIKSIITDAEKLREDHVRGLVAFVLFPVPLSDNRWHEYLDRISRSLSVNLSEQRHCARVEVVLNGTAWCEVIVCCFGI